MSIEGRPDRDRSLATIHAALDAGVTLIDTADAYHLHADEVGHNETPHRRGAAVLRRRHLPGAGRHQGRPPAPRRRLVDHRQLAEHLREACEASLKRLGVDAIGLYQFHRPDPGGPYAESVGALGELLDEGKIQLAGISNAEPGADPPGPGVLGGRLVSVQNQFSPAFRCSEPELRLCDELGIAFLPWCAARRHQQGRRARLAASRRSRRSPTAHGVSPQQVTLAWMLATSPVVIPIPGSSRPETARDSAAAVELELTADELQRLSTTG